MSKQTDFNQTARASLVQAAAKAAPAGAKAGGTSQPDKPPGTELLANTVESSSAEGAAIRLEKRTNLNTGKYRIQLINYGNGLGEIGWSFVSSVIPAKAGKGLSEAREKNEDRAVRRARSRLRQLILTVQADHLLTLTYQENVTDYKTSCSDFYKFVRKVKTKLPNWRYVAVPEKQKRGAWHWHIAVKGRQDVVLIRSIWRHIVGEGNIDVNPPKANQKNPQLAMVNYLCKYLGKGFKDGDHELNARRYKSSHGIQVPITIIPLPENRRHDASTYAVEMLKANVGSVGYTWIGESLPVGWACSWK